MSIIHIPYTYTITAGGGSVTINLAEPIQEYNLVTSGTVILTGAFTLSSTGSAVAGMEVTINYATAMAYDGGSVTILGRLFTNQEISGRYIIKAKYINAAWVVFLTTSDLSYLSGVNILDGTITSAKMVTGTLALNKIVASTRGNLIRGGASGVQESFAAVTAGQLVMGNGTDVVSQAMTGDISITGGGVTAIQANAIETTMITDGVVTVAKLTSELQTLTDRVTVSFETGEQGAYKMQMKFAGSVTNVYAAAVKAIAATDSGTVILKNNAGTTMTVTTPIVFAASDAFGTAYNSAVTANNTFVAGDVITITTAKVTVGGKALVTLTLLRS